MAPLMPDETARLLDLLAEQLEATENGELSGYGQDKQDELADIRRLIDKIKA